MRNHKALLSAIVLAFLAACTTTPQTAQDSNAVINIPVDSIRNGNSDRVKSFPEPSERRETSATPGMPLPARVQAQVAGTYFTELDEIDTGSWRVGNIPYLRVTVDPQYDTDGYLDQLEALGTTATQNYANTDYNLPATVNATTTIKLIVAKPLVQTSNTLSVVLKRADNSAVLGTQAVTLSSTNQIGSYSDVSFHQIQNLSFSTAGLAANQTLQLWLTDLQSGAKFFAGGIRITNGTTTTNIDNVDFTKKNAANQFVWRKSNLTDIKKLFVPQGETAEVPLHRLQPYLAAGGYVVQRLKNVAAGQTLAFKGVFALPTATSNQTLYAYLQDATTAAQIPNSGQNVIVSSTAQRISFTVTKPASVTGDVDLVIANIPFGQALYMGNFKEPTALGGVTASIGPAGGGLALGGTALIGVPANAVSTATTFGIKKLVALPAPFPLSTEEFLVTRTPGASVVAMYEYSATPSSFANSVTVIVPADTQVAETADLVTRVYVWTGTKYVSIQRLRSGNNFLVQTDQFPNGKLTVVVVRASGPSLRTKCTSEGGTNASGYCRLPVQATLSAQAQASGTYKVLSINVGNIDLDCLKYAFKLCSSNSEDQVRAELDRIFASGKPDIVAFQEVWHNDCTDTSDEEFFYLGVVGFGAGLPGGSYVRVANHRICAKPDGTKQIERLIDPTVYDYRCSPVVKFPNTPGGPKTVNGYECVAFLRAHFTAVATDTIQPPCNATLPGAGQYYQGSDTGWQVVTLRLNGAIGTPAPEFDVVNGHLIAPNEPGCRGVQFKALKDRYFQPLTNPAPDPPFRLPVRKRLLVLGDLNTDPILQSASDAGANGFRELFSEFGATVDQKPYNKLAYLISNPAELTAWYILQPFAVWWNPFARNLSLDHVISNFADGSCTRREAVANMDHNSTLCSLKGFDSGMNTLSLVSNSAPVNGSVVVTRKGVRLMYAYDSLNNHPSTGKYIPILPDGVPVNLRVNPCLLESVFNASGSRAIVKTPQLSAGQNLIETLDLTSTPCAIVLDGKRQGTSTQAAAQFSLTNPSSNPVSYGFGWNYTSFIFVTPGALGTTTFTQQGPFTSTGVNGTLATGQVETLKVSTTCTSTESSRSITMSTKDLVTLETQLVNVTLKMACADPAPVDTTPTGYKYLMGCSTNLNGAGNTFDPNNEQTTATPWAWNAGRWSTGSGFPAYQIYDYGFVATEAASRDACLRYANSSTGKGPVLLVERYRRTGLVTYAIYEKL